MNSAINPPIAYRADIDGLRAIAVTAVVAFHAFPSLFPGGFIGVDVFFVISGFLITSIILKGADTKQFKFLAFYERRLRRLLPAYVTMVTACLIAGWVLLFPKEFAEFGGSVAAASVFAANFWFLQEKSDYFANDAEFWPLLHVWSLAVEEQFYLVAPLIIIVLIALFHRAVAAAVIGLIFIASLSASVIITPGQPDLAFFSPATRA
ncbi:MAG: acyltransferase [Pseudomonadota bacterium]